MTYKNKQDAIENKVKYYQKNKVHFLSKSSNYYKNNKDKVLRRVREARICKYFPELTKEQALEAFDNLYKQQNGLCGICKQPEFHYGNSIGKPRRLAIDHCHLTGKVRGLLCTGCNVALGVYDKYKDRILEYLNKE